MGKKPRAGRKPRAKRAAEVLVAFRLTPIERKRYQRAAEAAGLALSDWIRGLCEAALKRATKGRS